ncbi:MAG: phenylalanine--tRNA ligase subunit beta [Ignavibacteriae bacterium]|nr:phenylalanine--tRNA ligase subunit beta [Ignavibacteriota bacterium]MCB9242975.1 phenylalanine--tRNA ligase subunit beta [Ignavibacteriales bacterium]
MKVSLNWIKTYLPDLKIGDINEFVEKMWGLGFDIETVEYGGERFAGMVVGLVKQKRKHPNADKLSICIVDVGDDREYQVVCGAPNVAEGQKVCMARIGAVIPVGEFEIKKAKLRGEVSEGMICSEKELGLSDDHEGIMVLKEDAEVGMPFAEYLGADDVMMDIWVPPNRGDLSSHIGIAREIGAIYDMNVQIPKVEVNEGSTPTEDLIKISIKNNEFCKRFTGRVIENVTIKESPEWLKKRLTAVGLRPRNNIVDITNFVMMETGQPLHSFDYDTIRGKEIMASTAKDGDKFVTLDSKERTLSDSTLMICDRDGYSGIAGVMGGELSEITDDTKNVFLEVAYFDPVNIRRTAKRLGLFTDASQRFEKGVDIDNLEFASNRAAQLIEELAGGEISKGIIDVYPAPFEPVEVGVRAKRASDLLGVEVTESEIIKHLDRIDIKYLKNDDDYMIFEIPEYRRYDIEREVDLIEEIGRLNGFDKLNENVTYSTDLAAIKEYSTAKMKKISDVREYFIGRGFNEILTGSLLDKSKLKHFGKDYVELENPSSSEMNALRTNLEYGMLNSVRNNVNHSGKDIALRLFEIGKIHGLDGRKFTENYHLCFTLSGMDDTVSFDVREREADIFDIKGEIDMFMSKFNIETYALFYYNDAEKGKIGIHVSDKEIGYLTKVSKDLLELFDIDANVFLCELDLDALLKEINRNIYYKEISRYPAVKRDLAFVINKNTAYNDIKEAIVKNGGEYLTGVRLFDVYTDKKLGDDKKSMAFSLNFSSNERTLTDDEINRQVDKIVKSLESGLGVSLRN